MFQLETYKGYVGEATFVREGGYFWGKLINIPDVVVFEGRSPKELIKNYKEAVDEFIELG